MKAHKSLTLQAIPTGLFRSKLPTLLLSVAAVMAFGLTAPAKPAEHKRGERELDVMTVNLYVGGNTDPVTALDPTDPYYLVKLVYAVAGVYDDIVALEPAERMQTVAKAIAARMPDCVGVQEATLLRRQSPGDLVVGGTKPATAVVYDYLQLLLDELAAQGAHYQVVAVANEADIELPMLADPFTFAIDDVRLSDREAILVRSDLPHGQLQVTNPQSGNYVNVVEIPALGIAFERGWCSADVKMRGHEFRVICTHLELETLPDIQAAQAAELLAGPAITKHPVVIVGDFNADPLHRDGSYAYDMIPAAGFTDAWAKRHHKTPAGGLTWGHDALLADPTVAFDRRIDFVFYHGKGLEPVHADVIDLTTGLLSAPLWATDHAAVLATFDLK